MNLKLYTLAFILFLVNKNVVAQKHNIENLVFAGAGIRGVAYSGAVKVLEEKGILKNVDNIAGNSAGSITAVLLSLGYTCHELDSLLINTKFENFNDGKYSLIGGTHRLINNYGWFKGDVFMEWIERLIENKTKDKNITFSQLKSKGYKNLYIVATSLTRQKLLIFNFMTYPNMPIKNAVRASMSIPYYYEAVYIDSFGKIVNSADSALDMVVDGGIINNYPIQIFDLECKTKNCVTKYITNNKTLGFRVVPQAVLEKDSLFGPNKKVEINGLNDYNAALYTLFMDYTNVSNLSIQDAKRTISIGDVHISARIRKLSLKEKEAMANSGKIATTNFLNQF